MVSTLKPKTKQVLVERMVSTGPQELLVERLVSTLKPKTKKPRTMKMREYSLKPRSMKMQECSLKPRSIKVVMDDQGKNVALSPKLSANLAAWLLG